jgi:hypothetical protein
MLSSSSRHARAPRHEAGRPVQSVFPNSHTICEAHRGHLSLQSRCLLLLLIGRAIAKREEPKVLPRSSYRSPRFVSHLALVSSGPPHSSGVGAFWMFSSHRFSFAFRSEGYAVAYPPGRVGRISQHLLASLAGATSTENCSGPADDLYGRQDWKLLTGFE